MSVWRIVFIICVLMACGLSVHAFQTDVFVSGQDGYKGYRIPALTVTRDGALLAFAEARKYNLSDPGGKGNDIDLVMKRSEDGGRTWSAMKIVEDPGEYWTAGNPSTIVDRTTGRIFLHYLRCEPERSSRTARPGTNDILNLVRHSDDGGKTWSEPMDITRDVRDKNDKGWRVSVFGPAGAIQDRKGRLIAPVWRVAPYRVFAVFSEDHGKTWRRGETVGDIEGDESQLVELVNGNLLMDIRQQKGERRWFAESRDGGKTWGEAREGLAATSCCCSLMRYHNGKDDGVGVLAWSGPLGPGRNKLGLRVSQDDGRTFPVEKVISEEPAAYSSLGLLRDGTAGVLWERGNYKFLTFTLLTREFIEEPAKK